MKKRNFKTLLIGFAFSPNLKANVFEATRLAYYFNAKLFFLHVGEKTKAKENTFLDILKLPKESPEKIEILWEKGDPVNVILSACLRYKIDLLLLGALKRENVLKFYMGSIARKITRKASCSVLLLIDPSIERKPSQHAVVNAFESPQTEPTINAAFHFASDLNINKITLVEEINRSEHDLDVYDDKSLRRATLKKEKIKRREYSRVNQILKKIPKSYKDNIKIISQSIFGTRGYSIGHYAKLVRADVLIMNASETKKTFLSKFFPKDLDYILRELPTNVLIIQNTN
ncbi:MAG: universal stress protein [Flavobacteriaceae bacterium TMED220]|nr:MAG: universal stress protein [Flavobacteriaceae bacterium TMED220]